MFKYTIPSILPILFSSYTWKVKTKDKELFLTFDDGPHPLITPWVIEQLRLFNAKATFFCVGENVKKFPETYSQILDAGHDVGNHTFHHKNGWQTPKEDYFSDIYLAKNLIQSKLLRPPYGRIKNSQARVLAKEFEIIMWSKLSRDYEQNLNVKESYKQMCKVKNGDILVFHDSDKAFKNLQFLLPPLLAFYHNKGFQMLAFSDRK
jgi:peptidoglycan-N-acetylglucosamine deacetylase